MQVSEIKKSIVSSSDKYGDYLRMELSREGTLLRIELTDRLRGTTNVYQGDSEKVMPLLQGLLDEWNRRKEVGRGGCFPEHPNSE